ncbi:RagB/SusD family nutrient uptake outer membrane protein [Kaistella palustris]|uniref:RagB/SusD family nutrient uptake outer membrane protein n=1 Tax=Kaistella palustris TaxID=493376 RepID=UPI000421E1D4|nr:RagB/SusD family nutrient uptake outer membrane protein [Kaistella palustris]
MKKYFLIISTLFFLFSTQSCSDRDLELFPPSLDDITDIATEAKLQQLLNGAYMTMGSVSIYGTQAMVYGDLMGDKMFVNSNPSFLSTYNFNYNSSQQPDLGGFYSGLYASIANCNLVINNQEVAANANVVRLKGEAKTLRALAYFTLVNYYSPSISSGQNQEFGVPLVLGNYDVNITPARATVAEVYSQIVADLKDGINQDDDAPGTKTTFSKNAAKLLLSRVYLSRRGAGDAAAALQLATEVRDAANAAYSAASALNPFIPSKDIAVANYFNYFAGKEDDLYENHPETLWELDLNSETNKVTGIGANMSLPGYYYRLDPKKAFLFNQTFYTSFAPTDVRRGSVAATSLLTNVGVPTLDDPKGYWTNKYPQISSAGRYYRNIKVLRYSEAFLNRIEALHLTGQDALALTELNQFALSRKGSTYTGANILNDILTERSKEFYGEGQRFLDLKRYNIPLSRPSNCTVCDLAATDKLFVFPVSQGAMNANPNLTQYPGYN